MPLFGTNASGASLDVADGEPFGDGFSSDIGDGSFVLEGKEPPPQGSTWESWTSVGPLRLSILRRFKGRPAMLRFENVSAPVTMDEKVFTHSKIMG